MKPGLLFEMYVGGGRDPYNSVTTYIPQITLLAGVLLKRASLFRLAAANLRARQSINEQLEKTA